MLDRDTAAMVVAMAVLIVSLFDDDDEEITLFFFCSCLPLLRWRNMFIDDFINLLWVIDINEACL